MWLKGGEWRQSWSLRSGLGERERERLSGESESRRGKYAANELGVSKY